MLLSGHWGKRKELRRVGQSLILYGTITDYYCKVYSLLQEYSTGSRHKGAGAFRYNQYGVGRILLVLLIGSDVPFPEPHGH